METVAIKITDNEPAKQILDYFINLGCKIHGLSSYRSSQFINDHTDFCYSGFYIEVNLNNQYLQASKTSIGHKTYDSLTEYIQRDNYPKSIDVNIDEIFLGIKNKLNEKKENVV